MKKRPPKSLKQKTERPAARGLRERRSGQVMRLTVYVPAGLARATRVRAAEQGRTISAIVSTALQAAHDDG